MILNRSESIRSLLTVLLASAGCSGDPGWNYAPIGGEDENSPTSRPDGNDGPLDPASTQGEAGSQAPNDAAIDAASNLPPLESAPTTAELLVSLSDGTVMWWRSDETGARRPLNVVTGPAFGMAFDASYNLYVTHGFALDIEAGNAIEVFDRAGNSLGEFGAIYDCNPHSIVFDAMGHAYVGQSDCEADILRLDASGALLDTFDVETEARGADWIALADDQCTMFYTSQGPNVKRYDVCTGAQLADFNVVALPSNVAQGSGAQELKLVAGGGVLVANFTEIVLLDAAGALSRVYDIEGPDGWRGLDLAVGGTSFWVTHYSTSDVIRFDIASGEILERFNTGTPPLTLKSVAVMRP